MGLFIIRSVGTVADSSLLSVPLSGSQLSDTWGADGP